MPQSEILASFCTRENLRMFHARESTTLTVKCILLKLKSVFILISAADPSHKYLGYICEFRPLLSLDRLKSCRFPFVHNGKTYDSCAIDTSGSYEHPRFP
jgi:hypothetical protein